MQLTGNIADEVRNIRRELNGRLLSDKNYIIPKLKQLILDAVGKRVKEPVAIAFSGGVDSSVIALCCQILGRKFALYSVGLQGSEDLDMAAKISVKMKWPIELKILTLPEAEHIIHEVIRVTGRNDIVSVGVGAVGYAVMAMIHEKKLLTGLGSEEIFAGYERHKKSMNENRVNEECWKGLECLWDRDLVRDTMIACFFKVDVECPFLDKELVRFAMQIDPSMKISDSEKKIILREAAVELGLDREFAFRKKKAAQYGSSLDKAIQKLAKINGFKYKKDYLESL
jgi:asparagine synthetase B (glutamine-hydrolysing)